MNQDHSELLAKVLADAYGITLSRRRPTGVIPLKTLRAGLEPATYGLEDRCSIQLSYRSQGWALYASQVIMPHYDQITFERRAGSSAVRANDS